jgi:tRNA G10  N-methylase Trm11
MNGRRGIFRNNVMFGVSIPSPTKVALRLFSAKARGNVHHGSCPVGGLVLDPFMGAGTTAVVASKHNRFFIGIDLNPDYIALAKDRLGLLTAEKKERRNCL